MIRDHGERPRLVATDLDGTLLRSDGTLSALTAQVWRQLPGRGVETVIVTARPPRWMHALEHLAGPRGIALCGNGAFTYDVSARRVIASHCFAADEVGDLVTDLRAAMPAVTFAAERVHGPIAEPGYPNVHADEASVWSVGESSELASEPVGKLLALDPTRPLEEFLAIVAQVVGDRAHLAYSGAHGLAEINPRGVTKAVALARWCGDLGIDPAEVWAFGDMPNDLPMLTWAGRGYAVANAHPEVLAAASHTCGSNDADGVAAVLAAL